MSIIEFETDIDDALKSFPKRDCLFLSVSAEASYHLQRRGFQFLTDEDILSPSEFKAIGDENFEITLRWVRSLEGFLKPFSLKIENVSFRPFKWHFYRLKILVDAVRIRQLILSRLIEKESPDVIGAPVGADPSAIHDSDLFFHKHDSLYGLIVDRIAEQAFCYKGLYV